MFKLKNWFSTVWKRKTRDIPGDVWIVTRYNLDYPPLIDVFNNHEAAKKMYDYCNGHFDIVTIDFVPILNGFEVA